MQIENLNGPRKRTSAKKPVQRKTASPKKASVTRQSSSGKRVSSNKRRKRRKNAGIRLFWGNQLAAFIAIACLALILIGGAGYAIWYNSFTDVKLSDYASLRLSGYNEYGSAQLDMTIEPEYSTFFQTVEAKLNLSENLSNGDELVISYVYDENVAKENKLRVDDSDAHVTVNGLAEAKAIGHDDIFAGLNVSFTGIAPNVKIAVENTATEEPFCNIVYTVDSDKVCFDSGDEIPVRAEIAPDDLMNHAYNFSVSEEDLTSICSVPYGDRYFTDASQVTDDILSELEQIGFGLISESDAKEYGLRIFQGEAKLQPVFVGNKTTFKWANPYVISAYFHSVTDEGRALLETHDNDVQIVYGVTLTQADGTSVLTEMVIQFVDLLTHEDGTIDNGASSGRIVSVSYKDSNIKKLVQDAVEGNYITTKLTE